MFKRLGDMLARLIYGKADPTPDLSGVSDPLAKSIDWTLIRRNRWSYCSHRLRVESPDRVRLVMTVAHWLFAGFWIAAGLAMVIRELHEILLYPDPETMPLSYCLIATGVAFACGGIFMLYQAQSPTIFDRAIGYYWKGRIDPELQRPGAERDKGCALDEIHALQVTEGWIAGDAGNYQCYELNLILRDGRRLHVVGHGSARKLREDADQLAEFLGVPVWSGPQGD